MQINKTTLDYKNTYPNFTALKSVKFKDGYRKDPSLQLKLLNTIDSNRDIKDICKNYDVNILFHTYKEKSKYFSEMEVWCEKPNYNFIDKLKSFFKGGYYIGIKTFDVKPLSLVETTEVLIQKIEKSKNRINKARILMDEIYAKEDKNTKISPEREMEIQVKKKLDSMIYK